MLTRDYTYRCLANLYETSSICLKVGVTVAQFKFTKPKTSKHEGLTSADQDDKQLNSLSSSLRLVGGSSFSKQAALDQIEVKQLTLATITSMEETRKILSKWRRQGTRLKDIYLQGIAQSAKHIGELWCSDELNFVNVTIAFSRLQRAMHEFSEEFLTEAKAESNGLSLLVMTEPGSHHGLGAFMLSEFFRQAGWQVTLAVPQDIEDFKRIFISDWFDAVVVSMSTDRHIDAVSKATLELHKSTVNPNLNIYVGGPMAFISPQEMNWEGTVLLITDAEQAVEIVTKNSLASAQPSNKGARLIKYSESFDQFSHVSRN